MKFKLYDQVMAFLNQNGISEDKDRINELLCLVNINSNDIPELNGLMLDVERSNEYKKDSGDKTSMSTISVPLISRITGEKFDFDGKQVCSVTEGTCFVAHIDKDNKKYFLRFAIEDDVIEATLSGDCSDNLNVSVYTDVLKDGSLITALDDLVPDFEKKYIVVKEKDSFDERILKLTSGETVSVPPGMKKFNEIRFLSLFIRERYRKTLCPSEAKRMVKSIN